MVVQKRYGWVRDLPDRRDLAYVPSPALAAALPRSADLTGGFGGVYNQGLLGSCTANAIAGALQFLEAKEGAAEPVMPSRLFIYYNERAIEGTVRSDSGAQLRDGIKTVAKEGYCPEALWPYLVERFERRPPRRCYEVALGERVSRYLRLDQTPGALMTCLASGFPFVFGFSVYESFETVGVAETGVVRMPRPGEGLVGGHAVVGCGYDLETRRFVVRNSWGEGWGVGGYFTMPFEYLCDPGLSADFWTIRAVPLVA